MAKGKSVLELSYNALGRRFIRNFDHPEQKKVRVQYGVLAGWVGITVGSFLLILKITLGIVTKSTALWADALNILPFLANSIVVIVSFWIAASPATAKTPFGHGRMEYVAPLIMSVFLFVSGIQIGLRADRQIIEPQVIRYWPSLPWILLSTILIKWWLLRFLSFLGKRVNSPAILASTANERINTAVTLIVILGLMGTHYYGQPEIDGYIGFLAALGLFYSGYHQGKKAVVPLLGKAPDKELINHIREISKSVDGIEDVHEIIVHDYGATYLISLHAEVPGRLGPERMHEIVERLEGRLRSRFGGEVVCHTDPLMEKTPAIQAIESDFQEVVRQMPEITGYHDFRVVAESPERIIIIAHLDAHEEIPDIQFDAISSRLESHLKRIIPSLAYCSFYVTPKYSY